MKPQKPRRRWFRFRLRTLLVMVTLLSVPCGWVGWELDQRRKEKTTIAWVEEMGGLVYSISSNKKNERSWWEKTKDKWFGERVLGIFLIGNKVSDLSPLAKLKELDDLTLSNTHVSDLSPLAELKKLETITLFGNQVRDLSQLAELKKLKYLELHAMPMTEKQVQELKLALPNCKICLIDDD